MPNFPVCISVLTLQVLSLIHLFSAIAICYTHRQTGTDTHSLFLSDVCERLRFSAPSSLFPPACVNVRASCCSSQTTQWETDQPHRRGNPLFWLKEKARAEKKGTFMHPNPPPSSLIPVHCSPALNHVVRLPGFPATAEEEKRSAAITEEAMGEFC